jgi:hypothetical protein
MPIVPSRVTYKAAQIRGVSYRVALRRSRKSD